VAFVFSFGPLRHQACLTENPKSYSTWHHRKWVVLQKHADLQREMKLVNRWVSAGSTVLNLYLCPCFL
jgi:hypothetical protein